MYTNLKQIKSLEEQNEIKLYPKRGIALAKGEGVYVFDTDGNKYLDFMTNLGVNILGYSNTSITKAIAKQLEKLPSTHQTFYSEARANLLNEIMSILPPQINKVIFTNSGAESIEAAIKLAKVATGKSGFISTINSYHGRTLGSLSLTGEQKYKDPFLPLLDGVIHIPFNNIQVIKDYLSKNTSIAAVIVEPIQGEAGIIIPDQNYLKQLRKVCNSYGVLLILDEIQTAIRTGSWFAFEQYGIVPDILCLSKSFSYGIPFGLVITTDRIGNLMPKGGHGSTFAGNPLACVAAFETIKQIKKQKLLKNATQMGNYLLEQLNKIKNPIILNIKGKGLMIGLGLKENITPYLKRMQDLGLIAASSNSDTIRFLPPATVSKKEIDKAVNIVRKVFLNV